MDDPVEFAREAIRELYRRQQAGEITAAECEQLSLKAARVIANGGELLPSADPAREAIARAVGWAEANPRVVRAAVAGLIHALGHYARSDDEAR